MVYRLFSDGPAAANRLKTLPRKPSCALSPADGYDRGRPPGPWLCALPLIFAAAEPRLQGDRWTP